MNIIALKIEKLTPYEKNAKIHTPEQIEQIKTSIQKFGMNDPVGVWGEKNIIVEGHGRVIALKELGFDEVDCIRLDHLSDDERKAYALAHNKLTMNTDFDFDILKEELDALLDFDMDEFGFESVEVEDLTPVEDNFVVELPEEPKAKLGDVYQLGEHRLMCGDSTSIDDVERLMDGEKADMVFTDPPYGVNATGGRQQTKQKLGMKAIENDNLIGDNLKNFLSDFISIMQYKNDASIYICYPWITQKEFTEAIKENNLNIKNCIIWNKKVFGLNGFKGYRPQYEMIYFCCKDDFIWYGDKAQSNVWDISREIKREEQGNHPTPKPIEVIAKALNNSSKKEDIIYDAFGGSGSTLIACEQLNRKCYMMELDEHYCDVIIQRWENLTGKKAVKL